MTSGAGDRHAEKCLRKGIDLVVSHLLVNSVEGQAASVPVLAHVIKHRPDHALVEARFRIDSWLRQKIARDLPFPMGLHCSLTKPNACRGGIDTE